MRGVFVSETRTLAVPMAVAQHRLLRYLHAGDLDGIATAAYQEGTHVLAKAGVAGLGKSVKIENIPAYQRGATTVLPLRWVATGRLCRAFPVFDANLELTAAASGTQLLVVGSYRAPLGALGATIDRLVLHGVAQATIRSFVDQLADRATTLHQSAPHASQSDAFDAQACSGRA
jgi:hypothetical protein